MNCYTLARIEEFYSFRHRRFNHESVERKIGTWNAKLRRRHLIYHAKINFFTFLHLIFNSSHYIDKLMTHKGQINLPM